MESGFDSVVGRLRSAGIEFEVLRHDPVYTMEDVDRVLGIPPGAGVKCLVVARRGEGPLICGVHGSARLDLRAVAEAAATSRSRLSLAPAEKVGEMLGMPPGAVGLITPKPAKVFLDRSFDRHSYIYCGSGDHERTLKIERDPLVEAFGIHCVEMET